ncbi:glycosyltransferase 87 family protein [Streptomyces sp. CA-135486]|uniref:glycosyltransferase 87 family protein n=1 Tax=Streptomyces sp. CA-135486 TaxID=3240049 RepID=UPI003D9020EC
MAGGSGGGTEGAGGSGRGGTRLPVAVWILTRTALLLCVLNVLPFLGLDVTTDVSVIYEGWYEVLKNGTYPMDDVAWQYPPAAALAILSPALLPFLSYASAFFALTLLCDALVLGLLLYAGGRLRERRTRGRRAAGGDESRAAAERAEKRAEVKGKSLRGAWVWVAGVPLLGPTAYARYDLMVTAVAVAALLAGARHPRTLGALAAFGALLKVWPLLLLAGVPGVRANRRAWATAAGTAAAVAVALVAAMPGALAFVTFQRERGTEIESLGGLVFHVARHHGWHGQVLLNYGSVEFVGRHVTLVSTLSLGLALLALGWLVLWRLRVKKFVPSTLCDAAFTAVLLFTTTSRVISPQYMIWLVGLAGACLVFRGSRMAWPAWLVLAATGVSLLEFPVWFSQVVASDPLGVLLLFVRNGLLVAATLTACLRLWRQTVTEPGRRRLLPAQATRDNALTVS